MLLLPSLGFAEHPPALGTGLDGAKAFSKCFSMPVPQKGNFPVARHSELQKKPNKSHFMHCVSHTAELGREMRTEPSPQSMS